MKPIISFDIDMTLLDHKDWKIPASAMEAVERLRENYNIVIATGRDMDSVHSVKIKEEIKPDAVIHLNGAKITVGEELIYQHFFDKELLKRILEYGESSGCSVGASVGDYDYYINQAAVRQHDMDLWGISYRNFQEPWKLMDLEVRTLAYIGTEPGAIQLKKQFPQVDVFMFAEKRGADVVEKTTSKGLGLLRLCDYLQVPVETSVAFGDSMNDLDIIKKAGIGIAMGNAMPELKQEADYVTDSIGENGVWNACRHFQLF